MSYGWCRNRTISHYELMSTWSKSAIFKMKNMVTKFFISIRGWWYVEIWEFDMSSFKIVSLKFTKHCGTYKNSDNFENELLGARDQTSRWGNWWNERSLPPGSPAFVLAFSILYWYTCRVNNKCEDRLSSSSERGE